MSNTLTGPIFPPQSGKPPSHLVDLLHGLGADGDDLISLAPHFATSLPETHFIAPHAPYPCDMAPMGRQWFSLANRDPEAIIKSLASQSSEVNQDTTHRMHNATLDRRVPTVRVESLETQ